MRMLVALHWEREGAHRDAGEPGRRPYSGVRVLVALRSEKGREPTGPLGGHGRRPYAGMRVLVALYRDRDLGEPGRHPYAGMRARVAL